MISSSFFGVLIPEQGLWKGAEVVDRRFPVLSPGKKFHFQSHLSKCHLSKRFGNHHLNFHRQGTISLFSTPNCQSDPESNPKRKLETQDLLAGSLN